MFRKITISALGAAMLLTTSVPAFAMPRGNGLPVVKTESVQLIGHRGVRRQGVRNNRGRSFRGGNFRQRNIRRQGARNNRGRSFRGGNFRGGNFRGGNFRYGGYRYGGYRYGRYNDGAAFVAGIIGLGTGLAIANSYRGNAYYGDRYDGYQSGSPEWIAACARKYRSFEPRTGLYTAYSGYKRRCRLP